MVIMNTVLLRKWAFVNVIIVLMVFCSGLSMSSSSNSKAGASESAELQRYFWYDGDRKKSVWVNPELIAEFQLKPETKVQLKSLYAAKEVDAPSPYIRLWKIKDYTSSRAAARSFKGYVNSQLSPVLHDTPSTHGAKKALPGNVLVQMRADWSQEEIKVWFDLHDLVVIKPLTFAPNAFLIQTESGLDSLKTANRIYETGDVVLASPNWWQKMVAR